ncbi:MAG: RadC family protein [Acidithiobacillales bacterium]
MTDTARRPGPSAGRLADLPEEERPREKLLLKGPAALSDEELVAVILGTGKAGRGVLELARELLRDGGLHGLFRRGPADLLAHSPGVGAAKAARLTAVLEIAARIARDDLAGRDVISEPDAAAAFLIRLLAGESRELMGALLLDAKNRLLRNAVVFSGGAAHAAVAPSPLFRQAILAGATGVVLWHNHPSGDPEPSADDVTATSRFVAAGREIGIEVRDHLVLGRGRWVSFLRRGLLPR